MATYNPLTSDRIAKQDRDIDLIEKWLNEYETKVVQIRDELKEQNNKLDDLGQRVDHADDQVIRVTNKTKKEINFATVCGDCGFVPVIVFW